MAKAPALFAWESRNGVDLSAAEDAIGDGFGESPSGETPFDALAGLLKMIDVVEGRRTEATGDVSEARRWEGWILGR